MRYDADKIEDIEGRDKIFADAARHKLAVEDDVVRSPSNDHFGACIAKFGERFEMRDEVASIGGRIEYNDIWRKLRRRRAGRPYARSHVLFPSGDRLRPPG
jgi:hypothetical protein